MVPAHNFILIFSINNSFCQKTKKSWFEGLVCNIDIRHLAFEDKVSVFEGSKIANFYIFEIFRF